MGDIEIFVNACASVILLVSKQQSWKANLPYISAVAEHLGLTPAESQPGGSIGDRILKIVSMDGAWIAGHNIEKEAVRVAEKLFGPTGELAPNFMVK
jgi:hypothetical protein